MTRFAAKIGMLVVVFIVLRGAYSVFSSTLNPESWGELVPSDPTPSPEVGARQTTYERLLQQVAPQDGMTLAIPWGDMGTKLIASGAIDPVAFSAYHQLTEEQRAVLFSDTVSAITLTPQNIRFWINVLWALGLTQQSMVLDKGPMRQGEEQVPLDRYASTGGWTLGSRAATELYSSARLIDLTPEQDALIYRVAAQVFRPCCGNHTGFPDCNHGMAMLGLLELMAAQGASEEALYQAALIFNSYAFTDTYVTLAAYFAAQGISWDEVDPRQVLGARYSSAEGARRIAAAVGPIPGAPNRGGSCGI